MLIFRRHIKSISHVVLLGFLTLSLHVPAAHAGLVGTEDVVNVARAQQAHDRIVAALDREDVKQQLLARGVNPAQVQARVDALTNEETQQLATKLDQLPAGADVDVLGLAVLVFLILLITDIAGYTDIFPFVKKPARR